MDSSARNDNFSLQQIILAEGGKMTLDPESGKVNDGTIVWPGFSEIPGLTYEHDSSGGKVKLNFETDEQILTAVGSLADLARVDIGNREVMRALLVQIDDLSKEIRGEPVQEPPEELTDDIPPIVFLFGAKILPVADGGVRFKFDSQLVLNQTLLEFVGIARARESYNRLQPGSNLSAITAVRLATAASRLRPFLKIDTPH